MTTLKKLALLVCVLSVMIVTARAADRPRVVNAKVGTRSVAGGLEREFHSLIQNQKQPLWIGYAMPAVPGNHMMCCCDSGCRGSSRGGCVLEGDQSFNMRSSDSKQADLEGPNHFYVLIRVTENKVVKVRTFSEECELNAGGLPFIWLTDVKPAESITLLYFPPSFGRRTTKNAMVKGRAPALSRQSL